MLLDSHAHLASTPMLQSGIDQILRRASEAGVEAIIIIATNPQELDKGIELQKASCCKPSLYLAGSTTPHDAEKEGELFFDLFAKAAKEGKLIAIGETGLDYYYYKETAEIQKKILRKYLKLAKSLDLPLIIHCRDAFEDFFTILDEEKNEKGVLHCFTGTLTEAKELIERGWYLSLSGIVTYKKSEELKKVAAWVPLERLLIETDSPYLAPQSKRGKQNEPAFLAETAACIAEIRGLPFEKIGERTTQNAKRLFNLK